VAAKFNVNADLTAEGAAVDRMLTDLTPEQWSRPTPAPGWTVAHQVAHMAATFRLAALSAAAPAQFTALVSQLGPDFDANVEAALAEYVDDPPDKLLARWRAELDGAARALARLAPDHMVPWLVRPLPAAVLAAAGIMELVAHGQDIADAAGVPRELTDRIWHVADFGIRNWDFAYQLRGLPVPDVGFGFDLVAPSGEQWRFGPPGAAQRISGPAADFCLLITRRRHRDDLAVTATGADADGWLDIAQAYRGPAGPGRQPGQFVRTS